MNTRIRVAVNGYGNLGKAVVASVKAAPDMELVAVFSRRSGASLGDLGAPVVPVEQMEQWVGKVDVCLNCGGSATDLAVQGPQAAAFFNTVDSFDTHAKIPEYFEAMDGAGRAAGTLSLISSGWDPGLFSLNRLYGEAILPEGQTHTFWGRGVSQGHGDAIRRVEGVADGVQYTVPVPETLKRIMDGEGGDFTTREKHTRHCYVVAQEGADRAAIERTIKEMPNYFADYDTEVVFVSAEELARDHGGMPHGGHVIRQGVTPGGESQVYGFELRLGSNPQFTGAVVCAAGRAVARLAAKGKTGAVTMFDVAPALLSPVDPALLRKNLL